MSSKTRKYATATHPTIEALIHTLYRYPTPEKARERFDHLCKHFVLSKEQPESTPESPAAQMWIKGFAVTEDEAAKGFTGQFAEIRIVQTEKGQYTLTATRVEKPISSHPQKKRLVSKHPNWGHPVMRAVKKQKRYETLEEATAELELLHSEFPDVSIPGVNKLYIIIYEKREGIARPTHKIALELKPHTEGGFVISWRDNEKPAKPKSKLPPGEQATGDKPAAPSQQGYFTSMVSLRKKKRGAVSVPKQQPDETGDV